MDPVADARTILVIEDQEQNLYLMKYLLEANGYEAILAREGHEGVAKARSCSPDLILLDIQLPTISGYDVAREIRRDGRLGKTPIIAVTSFAMPGDREDALAAGCSGYVEKPIDPECFIGQMEAYLQDKADDENGTSEASQGGAE